MFLLNSRSHLVSSTAKSSRRRSFTFSGAPSPEVTVPICLVPSSEFSQAPWYSLPVHLCRFWYGLTKFMLRGFSWKLGISIFFVPKDKPSSRLRIKHPDLPRHSPYTLEPRQPSRGIPNLLRPPVATLPSTGILTCVPSTTRFRLALGADSPCSDER